MVQLNALLHVMQLKFDQCKCEIICLALYLFGSCHLLHKHCSVKAAL